MTAYLFIFNKQKHINFQTFHLSIHIIFMIIYDDFFDMIGKLTKMQFLFDQFKHVNKNSGEMSIPREQPNQNKE